MSTPTEKSIRASLNRQRPQTRFGDNSIRLLLSLIDEQRGELEMWKANADEAALKAARLEAENINLVHENSRISFEKWQSQESENAALFENLARENAFEELKRRDEERQAVKSYIKNNKIDWISPMTMFCMAVVRGEDVGERFGYTAAALQAEWRRMAEKIEALEKEVKCCRKGEQE